MLPRCPELRSPLWSPQPVEMSRGDRAEERELLQHVLGSLEDR